MAESTPNATDPKASKAGLIKNIIFAVFIILAIFYCFSQFNKGQKIKDLNRAVELLDQAREASPVDFTLVNEAMNIIDGYQEADFSNNEEAISLYVKTKSLCLSTLAESPSLDAKESELYLMKAYALDECNPDIPDQLIGQFQGLTPEERAKRSAMREEAQKAMEEGAKQLQMMEQGITQAVDEAKDAAADAVDAAKDAAADAVEAVKDAAEDAVEAAKDAAEDAVEAAKDAVEKAAE